MLKEPQIKQSTEKRDALLRSLVSIAQEPIRQLEKLPQGERNAIVAVMAVGQVMGTYARSQATPDQRLVSAFFDDVGRLASGPPVDFRGFATACRSESIAYASSMARCLKDGKKTNDQCEQESASEGSAEIICMMRQMEVLRDMLPRIVGGGHSPGPGPGPLPTGPGPGPRP